MSQSTRIIYRNLRGRTGHTFNRAALNRCSAVILTAAQWHRVVPPNPDDPWGRPHLGDADVYVPNIGRNDPEGATTRLNSSRTSTGTSNSTCR